MSRALFIPLLILCLAGCATVEEQPIPDRAPSTVPAPSVADVSLPPGYRAEVVVSMLNYPSSITFDSVGNLYVAESGAAPGDESRPPRILRIAPGGQIDIMSDKVETPVKDLQWRDGRLFVWHGEKISTVDHEGQLREPKGDSVPPAGQPEEKITSLTAAFGRPGQVFRIVEPSKEHGGQVVRIDPKSRRASVFFCARAKEKEASLGASLMTKNGLHSFPETGVIWRIVKDGTSVNGPPANLAPPPQPQRRPPTGTHLLP